MSTADLAIIGLSFVSLAHVVADYRVRIRVADRLRLVNPPKQQEKPGQPDAGEKLPSVLDHPAKRGAA